MKIKNYIFKIIKVGFPVIVFAVIFGLMLMVSACSSHEQTPVHGEVGVAVDPQSIKGNTLTNAGPTSAVSGGANPVGVIVPTGPGVVSRIENGLEKTVSATKSNFGKALGQLKTNLPKTSDVTGASGFDQVELLVYAACSDLTTGTTPLMQSKYNIQPNAAIATNQSALVAAGMRMLDQHTAGLASQGPGSAQVATILTTLVQNQAAVGSNTSTIAFMAVCMAANTAATTMLGL